VFHPPPGKPACAVPTPCAWPDLLLYDRRSCPFASSTCSWSACPAGWRSWRVRREVPSGLASRMPTAAVAATERTWPLSLRIPWQATGVLGASAPATSPPCECRLPAGCTERDGIGIGDSGGAPRTRARGLDHWSREPRGAAGRAGRHGSGANAPHRGPRGPFLTNPGLLGPCARATTEQPSGQIGRIKNDLE
jgi:hypothetical protein